MMTFIIVSLFVTTLMLMVMGCSAHAGADTCGSATNEESKTLIKKAYEAYSRGDIPGFTQYIHPKVRWAVGASPDHTKDAPDMFKVYEGSEGLQAYLKILLRDVKPIKNHPVEMAFTDDGKTVFIKVESTTEHRVTKKIEKIELVHRIVIDNGKTVEFQSFLDRQLWKQITSSATAADIRQLITSMFDALGKQDLDAAAKFSSKDVKVHGLQPQPVDLQGWKAGLNEVFTAFDAKFTPEDIIVDADNMKVVVRYRVVGTHKGPFKGIPPSNKPINVGAIAMYRMELSPIDGRLQIIEKWNQPDMLLLMSQIGAFPMAK
jgi:ketosteroid isomerase-like protein